MHIGIKIAAGLTGLFMGMGPNTSGCTGGGPMPGQDEASPCIIDGRGQNSKGQWYVSIECNRADASGLDHKAELLPNNDARAWPGCTMGATWPDCKK